MNFLKGKRTYIVAVLFIVGVLVPIIFGISIPDAAYGIASALGMITLRAGIAAVSGNHGWRTYAAAIAVFLITILNAIGVNFPVDIVYTLAGAFGIIGIRKAVEGL